MEAVLISLQNTLPRTLAGGTAYRAFLWSDGIMQPLDTLGGLCSMAYAINEAGQIVGFSDTADGHQHAALCDRFFMILDKYAPFCVTHKEA